MSAPQDDLTVTTTLVPGGGHRTSFGVLARLETARLARHPLFVAGTMFGIFATFMTLNEADQVAADSLSLPVVALTVGLPAMIVGYLLTRSFHGASELTEAAPTPLTARTGALCFMVVVPALVASGWLVLYYAFTPPSLRVPAWVYGMFSHADIASVLVGNSVMAAAGGTLLGVAAGRWWQFRGAAVVLLVGVTVWTIGVLGLFSSGEGGVAPWQRWVRLFTPVGYFTSAAPSDISVSSLTGSPSWYLVWLVTLCALAAVAALLWRAEGPTRRRLIRLGAIVLVLSAVAYGLAASGGLSQVVRTYPDGHSVVLAP